MPIEPGLLAAAYRLAEPSLLPALTARLPQDTCDLLATAEKLPRRLTIAVLRSGDRVLLEALARGLRPYRGRREECVALIRRLGPEQAKSLYGIDRHTVWAGDESRSIRAAVLEAAAAEPGHPAWRAPGGLVPALLTTSRPPLLTPALRAPFPEVVRHALTRLLPDVSLFDQYAACRAVLTYGGPERLAALVALPGLSTEVVEAVSGPDRLTALDADPAAAVITMLRRQGSWHHSSYDRSALDRAAAGLDRPTVLWPAVLAAHRASALPDGALRMLWQHPGCPDELLLAAYRCHGTQTQLPNDMDNPLPWEVLTGEHWRDPDKPWRVPHALHFGMAKGWYPVERVLAEVPSANFVIGSLPRTPEVSRALCDLVAPLGTDTAAWRALPHLLARPFAGSCTELVAAALEQTTEQQEAGAGREGALNFQTLLAHAGEETLHTVLPQLGTVDLQGLFVGHRLSDATRDSIIGLLGESAVGKLLTRMSRGPRIDPSAVDHLFRLDRPEVNAKLLQDHRLTPEQERHLFAGTPQKPGSPQPLPLDQRVVRHLSAATSLPRTKRRATLLRAVESGDPRVARIVLGGTTLHTLTAQLALVVRLWQASGPQEVRALLAERTFPGRTAARHPLPAKLHKLTLAALGTEDGLKTLQQRWEQESSPAGKVAFLRTAGARTTNPARAGVQHLHEETSAPLPWDELVRSHRADPLPEPLLAVLAEQPDCPTACGDAHRAGLCMELSGYTPAGGSGPRPGVLDLLRSRPLETGNPTSWLERAVEQQVLTPLDVLRDTHPAVHAVRFLSTRPPHRRWVPAHREIRRLTTAHLGTDTDAWTTALTLLPDFAGTLPELLATARAVVG